MDTARSKLENYYTAKVRATRLRNALMMCGILCGPIENHDAYIGFQLPTLFDCEGTPLLFSYSTKNGELCRYA